MQDYAVFCAACPPARTSYAQRQPPKKQGIVDNVVDNVDKSAARMWKIPLHTRPPRMHFPSPLAYLSGKIRKQKKAANGQGALSVSQPRFLWNGVSFFLPFLSGERKGSEKKAGNGQKSKGPADKAPSVAFSCSFSFGRKKKNQTKAGNGHKSKGLSGKAPSVTPVSRLFRCFFSFSRKRKEERKPHVVPYGTTAASTSPMGWRIVSAAWASRGVAERLMTARSRPWK